MSIAAVTATYDSTLTAGVNIPVGARLAGEGVLTANGDFVD
jgi:hypothetical protein